jgi:type I restriction enzyme R subunit
MREKAKRLLRKDNYPPEGQEQALEVVMEQCNQWADQEYYDAIAESGGRPIF